MSAYARGFADLDRPRGDVGAAPLAFGLGPVLGLLAGVGIAGALAHGQRWITLSNKRRVAIDEEGRLVRGLPSEWQGAHVADVSTLSRELRGIESDAATCAVAAAGPETFRSSDEAAAALLEANPHLREFLDSEGGMLSYRFRQWHRRGRRGPKPGHPEHGAFDAFNRQMDLKGGNRVGSWLEALYRTAPPSRRWEDLAGRLPMLEDATGLRLSLPAEAERRELAELEAGECQRRADEAIDAVLERAKTSRLLPSVEDVPF